MKKIILIPTLCLVTGFCACIQDEPQNPEADILSFSIPQHLMLSEPVYNNTNIFISTPKGEDLSAIIPQIKITEGATIIPSDHSAQDFTNPVTYTVTSENRKNQRRYLVTLDPYAFVQTDFDHWDTFTSSSGNDRYETPIEVSDNGNKIAIWSSSNKGVAIYQHFLDPDLYPVHSTTLNKGKAVVLETRKGPGNIMNIQYIPIVAGSLFTGTMNIANAIEDPLSATQFGIAYTSLPDRIQGHYSYQAGAGSYINSKGEEVPGKTDMCALYAVFYEVDENVSILDGNNILSSPNIVAVTEETFRPSTPGTELIPFDIPFIYNPKKEIDFSKHKYKLAIIFSSSYRGDHYEGTPGSKMIVDDIRVMTKNNENNE